MAGGLTFGVEFLRFLIKILFEELVITNKGPD
jgi:hypothetical protein